MVDRKQSVLITGATGIFGSSVLSEALTRGYHPIALMRDSSPAHARKRLDAVLAVAGGSHSADAVDVVEGDVTRPNLGMDPRTARSVLGRISAVVHSAACTSFNPDEDVKIWETNVHGVEHVLDFLSGATVPLYHVSTAYVAGGRRGTIQEYELDGRFGFTNTYESTKWLSERQVRSAFSAGEACGAIFRPGILVGASGSGAISDFQNFYKFLRLIDLNPIQAVFGSGNIRLEGYGETLSNLTPVDWAAKALWEIIEQEGTSSRTYHLTNPHDDSLEDIRSWANRKLANVGGSLSFVDELTGKLSFMEAFAARALKHYLPYIKHDLRFDASNTLKVTRDRVPFPRLDDQFYDRLFDYARRNRWKRADGVAPNNAGPAVSTRQVSTGSARRRPISVGIQVPAMA